LYPAILHIALLSGGVNLDQILQCFWDNECFEQATLSPEQKQCEQHFTDNTAPQKDGTFVVRLPLDIHSKQLVKSRKNGRTQTSAD
jgi:hypothetical protein